MKKQNKSKPDEIVFLESKVDSNYRVKLREVIDRLFADMEENQDLTITTKRQLVVDYFVEGIVKSDFAEYVRSNPDKIFGEGWAQG